MKADISRKLVAEFLGTAMLLAAVVGSGIMAERLSAGNNGLALLANTIATGAALFALIVMLAETSGAHFNPAVTLVALIDGTTNAKDALLYVIAQIAGALLGTALANLMFDLPLFFASTKARTGVSQWLAEFVATFGLIAVIVAATRQKRSVPIVAASVACYITTAYWFTSSTSFANPAVTIARSLSDTFAGIRFQDVPAFVVAQLCGALASTLLLSWLVPREEK